MHRWPLCIGATGSVPELVDGVYISVPIVYLGALGDLPTSWSLLLVEVVSAVAVESVSLAMLCLW